MVKHVSAAIGTAAAVLVFVYGLIVWKRHGDDFVLGGVVCLVSVLVWLILVAVIVRYWKDANQAKKLRADREAMKIDHKQERDSNAKKLADARESIEDLSRRLGKQCGDNTQLQMQNGILDGRAKSAFNEGRQSILEEQAKPRQKPTLTPAENIAYQNIRAEFQALSWAQKVALRYLLAHPGISEFDFCLRLQDLGFSKANPVEDIIAPLIKGPLVDYTPVSAATTTEGYSPLGQSTVTLSKIEVKTGKVRILSDLLEENPL